MRRRSAKFHKVMVEITRKPESADMVAELLKKLPVDAKDEARKRMLLKELKAISRGSELLYRRARMAADRIARLSVPNRLIDV